jgi:hypothetical protein
LCTWHEHCDINTIYRVWSQARGQNSYPGYKAIFVQASLLYITMHLICINMCSSKEGEFWKLVKFGSLGPAPRAPVIGVLKFDLCRRQSCTCNSNVNLCIHLQCMKIIFFKVYQESHSANTFTPSFILFCSHVHLFHFE